MSDPRAWTIIGVFAAAETDGLRAKMNGRFAEVRADIRRLDRDVQAITEKLWRGDRDV